MALKLKRIVGWFTEAVQCSLSKITFNMAIVVHAIISVLSGLITMGFGRRISDIQIIKGTTFEICNEHWAQNPLSGINQKLLHAISINLERTANMLVGWICWILPPRWSLVNPDDSCDGDAQGQSQRYWSATLLGHLKVDTLRNFGRLESCGFFLVVCFVLSGFVSCTLWDLGMFRGWTEKIRYFQAKWKSTHWGDLGRLETHEYHDYHVPSIRSCMFLS